jgi:hypothetical protein
MANHLRQRSNEYESLVTAEDSEDAPILIERSGVGIPKKVESTICEYLYTCTDQFHF